MFVVSCTSDLLIDLLYFFKVGLITRGNIVKAALLSKRAGERST